MEMTLKDEKTMTRRLHVHPLGGRDLLDEGELDPVQGCMNLITRALQQRLGDMMEEDARKEGGYALEEYKEVSGRINGKWVPDDVWVYE